MKFKFILALFTVLIACSAPTLFSMIGHTLITKIDTQSEQYIP